MPTRTFNRQRCVFTEAETQSRNPGVSSEICLLTGPNLERDQANMEDPSC